MYDFSSSYWYFCITFPTHGGYYIPLPIFLFDTLVLANVLAGHFDDRGTEISDSILVTGASGFLGSSVMRQALDRGFRVRVLVRTSSPRTNLEGLPVELVEGDLRDAASMTRAMDGVRYLFHVAADYRLWAPDPEEIVRNNRIGTVNVMEAARAAGDESIVYKTSVAKQRVAGAKAPVAEAPPLAAGEAIGADQP
ncbi:NAD-dependent epimerase/dehydratase family protein, partial [Cupriavidus plantarum]|uniref:NAD-dependent epimerase/dehydratase family protein n=1 Tax=Cupriavidus plantarum TaxID=942865 RepID=UPI0038B2AECD